MNPSRPMKNRTARLVGCVWIAVMIALVAGCGSDDDDAGSVAETNVEPKGAVKVFDGEESFANRCAVCHGETANGTQTGPPLVHILYEIGHHPNFSFHSAVNNGVPAHHWNFGDMPAIPNVAPEEIDAIICHVRDLQRAEGITAGEPC